MWCRWVPMRMFHRTGSRTVFVGLCVSPASKYQRLSQLIDQYIDEHVESSRVLNGKQIQPLEISTASWSGSMRGRGLCTALSPWLDPKRSPLHDPPRYKGMGKGMGMSCIF